MIKPLENAIEKIRALPEDRQVYVAEILEQIADDSGVHAVSDDERRFIREGLAELDRGDVATEAQVRAVFDKYRT